MYIKKITFLLMTHKNRTFRYFIQYNVDPPTGYLLRRLIWQNIHTRQK